MTSAIPEEPAAAPAAVSAHVRGSSALLAGRVLALAVDFAAHVIAVRYLTKDDYGAFSYAFAVALLISTVVVLGFPETLGRFVPIFQERGQRGRLLGAILVALAFVVSMSAAVVATAVAMPGAVGDALGSDEAGRLLAILILIVPTEGVNLVLQAVFAAFGRVRAIFLRQYVIVPLLRLGVAVALVVSTADVEFLAIGWVLTSVVGLLFYTALAGRQLTAGPRATLRSVEWPAREIVGFALPVFLTNVFWIVLLAFSTIALGVMTNAAEVADFQAVQPPSRLNYLVMSIFAILFLPTVARLFVQERFDELRDAYATTTTWLVVLTFPVLALTTVFAPVFVPTFFGEQYDSSTSILIVMSVGYFIHTAAGPNSATMKVFRQLRYTVVIDLLALALGIVLNLALIALWGALGAAVAFLLALIGRNAPYLWALRRVAGIQLFTRDYAATQGTVLLALALLGAVQLLVSPGLGVAVVLSAIASVAVLLGCRHRLRLAETFPELARGRLGALLAAR